MGFWVAEDGGGRVNEWLNREGWGSFKTQTVEEGVWFSRSKDYLKWF